MREILFRGKSAEIDEWVYGGIKYEEADDFIYGGEDIPFILPIDSLDHEVVPGTEGQYMGLDDRNGKQIFDGDIVKDEFGNIGVVRYSDHFLDWRIHFYKGRSDLVDCKEYGVRMFDWVYRKMLLEVIGNIHDNKELLEVKA